MLLFINNVYLVWILWIETFDAIASQQIVDKQAETDIDVNKVILLGSFTFNGRTWIM